MLYLVSFDIFTKYLYIEKSLQYYLIVSADEIISLATKKLMSLASF